MTRKLICALAALALFAAPAWAQEGLGFWPAAAGGGTVSNPSLTYEPIGESSGVLTMVTAGGTANTKGTAQTLGTTVSAWSGFTLIVHTSSSSSARFLIDVDTNGDGAYEVQNLFAQPGTATNNGAISFSLPLTVAAGSVVKVRAQSSGVSLTLQAMIVGEVASSSVYPGFTTYTDLGADTTNTRPSTIDVPLNNTWVQYVASTAANYSAFIVMAGDNGTAPDASLGVVASLGVGAAASEVSIYKFAFTVTTTGPLAPRAVSRVIWAPVVAGQRLAVRAAPSAASASSVRVLVGALN